MRLHIKKLFLVLYLLFSGERILAQDQNELSELFKQVNAAADSLKPQLYSRIGFYYVSKDVLDSALYYTNKALVLFEKMGNIKGVGNSYNNMGSIYRIYSNHNMALQFFTKAMKIYDKNELYREASRTIANMSAVYGDQKQYQKAVENLSISNQYAIKTKDTITLISNYATLANNFSFLKKISMARSCIDSGLALAEAKKKYPPLHSSDSAQFAFARKYLNKILALQLFNEKKFESSIKIYKMELKTGEEGAGVLNKIDLMQGLSENYIELGKYDSALQYMNIALELLKEDSIPKSYMNVFELRAIIFEKMGLYKDALTAHQQFKILSDSINSKESIQAVSDIQTRYETEKKDQEIIELNGQKKTQKIITWFFIVMAIITLGLLAFALRSRKLQQKLFLQKENLFAKEKEIEKKALEQKMSELEQMALRAQMNPHFIFNSLNSVQHFVMNEDVEGVNKYLSAFAHLIRQTLNNSGKNLISLDEEIKYLETYLSLEQMKSDHHFNYDITVAGEIDRAAFFVPGMILQPFVENCIKHGVAQKEKHDGQIHIHISKNGKLVCRIEDNGIGRHKAGEIKKAGADHESKGLSITMNRIDIINKMYDEQISCSIEDLDLQGKPGTRVIIKFPLRFD